MSSEAEDDRRRSENTARALAAIEAAVKGVDPEVRRRAAPATAVRPLHAAASSPPTIPTDKLVAASQRLQAAKAQHQSAQKAAFTAGLLYIAANASGGSAAKTHALRLERDAARQRAEAVAVLVEECQRECEAAVAAFQALALHA